MLRHIQVGKRVNGGGVIARWGLRRTWRSMAAASGQSASTATTSKPWCSISRRVIGGAGAVELAGPVAGLAEQHHAGVGVAVEGRGEGRIVDVRQGLGGGGEAAGQGGASGRVFGASGCAAARGGQVALEPVAGQGHHLFQRPRLLEQVRRARHQLSAFSHGSFAERLLVQLDDPVIVAADDQQGRRGDLRRAPRRRRGPAARRARPPRRTLPPSSAAAASAAPAPVLAPNRPSRQAREVRLRCRSRPPPRSGARPAGRCRTPCGGRAASSSASRSSSRVAKPRRVEGVGDRPVARAEPAGAAAVGEEHDRRAPRPEPAGRRAAPGAAGAPRAAGSPRPGRRRVPGLAQQAERLLVGQLVEIAVEGADAVERPRRRQADHLVGLGAHLRERVWAGATGTASTTLAAPWRLSARSAALAVAPVARPSSTTMAVRPAGLIRGRPPR